MVPTAPVPLHDQNSSTWMFKKSTLWYKKALLWCLSFRRLRGSLVPLFGLFKLTCPWCAYPHSPLAFQYPLLPFAPFLFLHICKVKFLKGPSYKERLRRLKRISNANYCCRDTSSKLISYSRSPQRPSWRIPLENGRGTTAWSLASPLPLLYGFLIIIIAWAPCGYPSFSLPHWITKPPWAK